MWKLFLVVMFLTGGCASYDYHEESNIDGLDQGRTYVVFCVSDVEYFRTFKGVAPHYKPDGTIHECKGE